MPKARGVAADAETRLSLLRVWLAISAVWVAFWLVIAGLGSVTDVIPLSGNIRPILLILVLPPLFLLALGALAVLVHETILPGARNA